MARSARALTPRELNRATLARQLLLERHRLPIVAAVERLGALQAQHPDWPAVALWSRLADLGPGDLPAAFEARQVVRASLMRITLHVVSAADFWVIWSIVQQGRLDQFRLMVRLDPSDPKVTRRLEPAVAAAVAALERRPLRREEFTTVLQAEAPRDLRDLPNRGLSRYFMAMQPLVQVPHHGEAYGRGRYATAESWLGPPADGAADDDRPARAALVRRHLAAFGPASLGDAVAWIGRGPGGIGPWRAALESLGDELVELRDEDGTVLWDLADAPRPPADTPAPPRLLARWDSVLLAHEPKRRTRILPTEHHARVNLKNGDVLPTLLVDGMVAGTWQLERGPRAATIELRPFARLRRSDAAALEGEARRLLIFVAPGADAHEVRLTSP